MKVVRTKKLLIKGTKRKKILKWDKSKRFTRKGQNDLIRPFKKNSGK